MNYYEILEVSPYASTEVIKMAYKALVKKYHPDVYNRDGNSTNEYILKLNEAYRVLTNTELRQKYDEFITYNSSKSCDSEKNYEHYPHTTDDVIYNKIFDKDTLHIIKRTLIIFIIVITLLVVTFISFKFISNKLLLNKAIVLAENSNYKESFDILSTKSLDSDLLKDIGYKYASILVADEDFESAYNVLITSDNASDTELYLKTLDRVYAIATSYLNNNQYKEASDIFLSTRDYKDSNDLLNQSLYELGIDLYKNKNYQEAKSSFSQILDYNDSYTFNLLCTSKLNNITNDLVLYPNQIDYKRSLLENLISNSNPSGTYAQQECYNEYLSNLYDDIKLIGDWENFDFKYLLFKAYDDYMALSSNLRKVYDKSSFKFYNENGKTLIKFGSEDNFITSYRIEGFSNDKSSSPTKLYLYCFSDGKTYELSRL